MIAVSMRLLDLVPADSLANEHVGEEFTFLCLRIRNSVIFCFFVMITRWLMIIGDERGLMLRLLAHPAVVTRVQDQYVFFAAE